MQRINLITVGKLKEPFYLSAVQEYAKRLQRHCKLNCIELQEQRLSDEPSAAEIERALATEAAAIREKLPKSGVVIAMCIEGKELSSEGLADKLQQLQNTGVSRLCIVIGSSRGLDEDFKKEAGLRLSMSPMTFPHHLARVMVLEQIYRGLSILAGSKYHK